MKKSYLTCLFISLSVALFLMVCSGYFMNKAVSTFAAYMKERGEKYIMIDAGHGGVDGGAVSCTGVYESAINLEIALRLNDLLQLLGYRTSMIRTEDISVYTSGNTIAEKKISDLKERVRLINGIENCILISIHQNFFQDSKYAGAQVFYSKSGEELARLIQTQFVSTVNRGSKRKCKRAEGVYLMNKINCTGVLVECGFLSNAAEESNLRSEDYQKKICCIIASGLSQYINISPSA